MSVCKEGKTEQKQTSRLYWVSKWFHSGTLKIKLHHQTKWHRRYCIIDWDKSILFIASRADSRYRDWIKLLPDTIINEYDHLSANECNNNGSSSSSNSSFVHTIEIKTDSKFQLVFSILNFVFFFRLKRRYNQSFITNRDKNWFWRMVIGVKTNCVQSNWWWSVSISWKIFCLSTIFMIYFRRYIRTIIRRNL